MSEPLMITLRTLTPLWTGGVAGKSERLHVTGIIGSLRWWYEAIVRGLGGEACDPVSDNKCRYDSQDPRPPEEQLCPACYVFGATGWRRRFRLKVVEDDTEPAWNPSIEALNIRPPDRSRGWYLPPGWVGRMTLRFAGDDETLQQLAALFLFLEQWGTLGAKPQLGYGAFEITNREEVVDRARDWTRRSQGDAVSLASLPDLRRFHFFRYTFTPARRDWWLRLVDIQPLLGKHKEVSVLNTLYQRRMVPTTPLLKNIWRYREWHGSRPVSRWIFGVSTVRKQAGRTVIHRVRSKIAVTWAYVLDDERWSMHGWLWLPERDDRERLPNDDLERLAKIVLRRETFTTLCGAVREETYQIKHGMEVLHD